MLRRNFYKRKKVKVGVSEEFKEEWAEKLGCSVKDIEKGGVLVNINATIEEIKKMKEKQRKQDELELIIKLELYEKMDETKPYTEDEEKLNEELEELMIKNIKKLTVREKCKYFRVSQGISLREMADMLNCSHSTLTRWEEGKIEDSEIQEAYYCIIREYAHADEILREKYEELKES